MQCSHATKVTLPIKQLCKVLAPEDCPKRGPSSSVCKPGESYGSAYDALAKEDFACVEPKRHNSSANLGL